MRGWLGVLVVCASSLAVADDTAFSPAPLGGALEGATKAADENRKKLDMIISSDAGSLGTFTGVKGGGGTLGGGPQPKVAVGTADGDTGGLTTNEIDRVIKSRAGIVRACYQKELNRTPKLAGKIVVRIGIAADGVVTSATIASTTMKSRPVEDCISAQLKRIKFPAKGATAVVTYPFIFSSG